MSEPALVPPLRRVTSIVFLHDFHKTPDAERVVHSQLLAQQTNTQPQQWTLDHDENVATLEDGHILPEGAYQYVTYWKRA